MREFMVVPYYPKNWDKRKEKFGNPFGIDTRIIVAHNKEDAIRIAADQESYNDWSRTHHYLVFDMRTAGRFEVTLNAPLIEEVKKGA